MTTSALNDEYLTKLLRQSGLAFRPGWMFETHAGPNWGKPINELRQFAAMLIRDYEIELSHARNWLKE